VGETLQVCIYWGPKLLEGQRPILVSAEKNPTMVVVAVQGAPLLSDADASQPGAGPVQHVSVPITSHKLWLSNFSLAKQNETIP